MKRFVLVLLAALPLLTHSTVRAETLTLIHPGPAGSLYEISAIEFAERLRKKLPAPYTIAETASPGLGDGLALLESVRNGRASFALASSGLVALSDVFAIFEMPFLFRSRDQIPAIREKLLDAYLQPAAKRHGLRIVGVWENGFRHIANDRRPIRTPADFRGLTIAVPPANAWRENMIRAFGAEPAPLSPRAFARPLEPGNVNGYEAPLLQIASLNLPEMQHHLALSDHLYSPAFLITGETFFSGLPPEIRKLIADEAQDMESLIAEIAIRVESELVDLLDQSMQMTHISRNSFLAASQPLYDGFARTVPGGAEMIEIVRGYRPRAPETIGVAIPQDRDEGSR